MGWLAERAERLEIERDQQASLGAAAERARIAREMHDIVAHSLSVVVTLADAASVVSETDPKRATEAMRQVSAVGRQALTDMRSLIGVLRTETANAELAPAPRLDQLDDLVNRVRATGLDVTVELSGQPFSLGEGVELTLYRIVQEALTNTLKHAGATRAAVMVRYENPLVELEVTDDGDRVATHNPGETNGYGGHGIEGMRERANLHHGTLRAGPCDDGGWVVSATVCNIVPST
jgi:signal transduction histidine kinase